MIASHGSKLIKAYDDCPDVALPAPLGRVRTDRRGLSRAAQIRDGGPVDGGGGAAIPRPGATAS